MQQSMVELERLAAMPPGAELAAALARLRLSEVANDHMVDVLQAQHRQLAHEQARMLATIVETSRCAPVPDVEQSRGGRSVDAERAAVAYGWATGELAAALTYTPGAAYWELWLAETVVCGLPLVFAALWEGRIDRAKARVFAEHLDPALGELTAEQIAAICARLVPLAPALTSRQLAARLLRAIIAIDPAHASRRYRRAVRARGVTCYLDRDGTAVLTAHGLPPDEAGAACERLDRLAASVRRAGHPSRLAQITADLFVGMLDGRYQGLTEDQIIAALLACPRPEDATDAHPATGVESSRSEPAAGAAPPVQQPDAEHARTDTSTGAGRPVAARAGYGAGGSTPSSDVSSATEPADPADASRRAAPGAPTDPAPPGPRAALVDRTNSDGRTPSADRAASADGAPSADHGPRSDGERRQRPLQRRAGIEIHVGLGTVLGLDEQPGEVPGLGPVLADVARAAAIAQRHGAEWRFAVTDAEGYLILDGVTRRRPRLGTGSSAPTEPCRSGVVELHVPASLLERLADDAEGCGAWAGVVADIADQYTRLEELTAALDHRPTGRYARGPLARHVQIRDRTCTHPGCTRPARTCHLDHTRDHLHGGPTTRVNLGPSCELHHRFKHQLGWRLRQPAPGHFEWTSPLRRIYRTRGEAILPELPEPLPHGAGHHDVDDIPVQVDLPILWRRLRGPASPRPPRPPPRPRRGRIPPL